MKFNSQKTNRRPRRKPVKRRLLVENLEHRQLLAVDGFHIDLSGTGTVDLLDPNAGSSIHDLFANGTLTSGSGVVIGTSNVPGQNNENPIAGDDTSAANEDGPTVTINVADLLTNDSDPDNSGALSVVAVDASSSIGTVTLDTGAGTISYDPNGAFEAVAQGQTVVDVFQYTLDDSANGRATGNVNVTITGANDAPAVTGTAIINVDEGSTATNSGTYGDIDSGSTVVLTTNVGNVVDNNNDGTWSWSMPTTDGDDLNRTVTITATDEYSLATTFDFTLNVNNVTPIIVLAGDDSVNEGTTYGLTLGIVTDPGDETITEYEIVWGDGSTPETFADNSVPLKSHIYTDGPDGFTIIVSITDEDGTHVAATKTITVNNVAPTADSDQTTVIVDEGTTATASGTYDDIGDDTILLSASIGTVTDNNNGTWSWSFNSTDGPTESQTVTITVTDSDGAATDTTFDLTVNNVAPVVAADNSMVTVNEGVTATNTGTFSDASGDTVTLTASVGTVTKGAGTWSWSFDSTDGPDQTQTVTITAMDQDGGQSMTTFALVVDNLAPVAAAQSISVLGNVPITRDWSTLLDGATDAGDDVLSVQSIDSTTDEGTLTVDSVAKTFRYVPDAGFEGTTTFLFTIADSDGATNQQTATISVDRILWVVDNSASSGGDGSIANPFDSFTPINELETSPDNDDTEDIIFVVGTDTSYDVSHGVHNDQGIQLEDNQFLLGSGMTGTTLEAYLATQNITVPAGSDALPAIGGISPTITNTTGDVITVANGNTISGVTLDPVASAGIAGEDVNGLVVEFTIIITSGGTGDNEGIRLKTVTGTMTISNVDIGSSDGQTNSGTAIQIDGGTANIQFNDVDIDQDGGALLEILNTAASTFTFDKNSELTLVGSDEAAVTISGNNGGTVTLNSDGFSADTTSSVTFNITGNTGLTATTPVNDAPVFVLPTTHHQTLEDGGPQTISGFATDITPGSDPTESGQTVTFDIVGNDNESIFAALPQLDAAGNLTYTLAADALGTANITVDLNDDGGTADGGVDTSEAQTFTIEVVPVNDSPSFAIASAPASVPEDAGGQVVAGFASSLLAGPADESNQTLQFEITGNTNADLFAVEPAISPSGDLTYTPADDATGTATITVVLKDDGGTVNSGVDTSASQTFVITVSPPINDAPSFTLEGNPDQPLEDADAQIVAGIATSISAGPDDESGQTLSFLVTNDNNALFTVPPSISADGTLTYTPAPNMHGTATLSISLQDSGGTANGGVDTSASQTLLITITPVNDAPVLATIQNPTIDELQTLTFTASASDVDVPPDTLTFSLDGSHPVDASITSAGDFSWMPNESDGAGTFTFDVVVIDGEFEDRQSITVTVNEVNTDPVLASIDDYNVDEGSELTFTASATDADLPANTLTYSLDGNEPAGATISSTGDFSWTPTEAQGPGDYTFDVIVSDGTTTANQSVTISVADVNNAPVLAAIGDQSLTEHTAFTLDLTATDTDLPADSLIFSLGQNAPAGLSLIDGDRLFWTPSEDQAGQSFTFDILVTDELTTDFEQVTWTVTETNESPELTAIGAQSLDEGVLHTFTASASDADAPLQVLAFTLAGNVPTGASISEAGVFIWTPSEDQQGTYTFGIVVSDGQSSDTETIQWTVNETNVAPVINQIADQSVNENELLTFTITATDIDVPSQNLTFSLGDHAPAGASLTPEGVFSWTPSESDGGNTFSYTVSVSDGMTSTSSSSLTITVNGTNDPPVVATIADQTVNEHELLSFSVNATDSDLPTDTLEYALGQNAPDDASIDDTGLLTWTPGEDDGGGTFAFDVVVDDGSVSTSQSVSVTVTETNADPTLASIDNQQADEGNELTFSMSATDADLPANTLQFSLGSNAPTGATITTSGDFSWTPTEVQGPGEYTFDVSVFDGTAKATESVTVSVADVNNAPVLAGIGDQSLSEYTTFTLDLSATDSDLPADTLIFSLGQNAPAGLSLIGGNQLSWTPSEDQGGQTFTFDIVVSDELATDSEQVTWTVVETNTAPVLDAISDMTVDEGEALAFMINASDADLPSNDVTLSIVGRQGGSWITDGGSFSWAPTFNEAGTYVFDVTATDNGSPSLSDTETITITVNDVVAPELADLLFEFVQGDLDGENKYFVYMELEAIGDDAGDATRIDLQRVNDSEFSRPEFEEGGQWQEYAYDSLSEFLAAHNGVHQFGIDYDGDGEYEDTFAINIDLVGFTTSSFPDYATINSPTGTIDNTTPTITWDSINGAGSLFVAAFDVNGPELEDLDELWYADLPAGATSVDTGELPTGEELLASVQANFRRDDLAISSSDDGTVNLSFFTSSIATSPFTIDGGDTTTDLDDGFDDGTGGVPAGWSVVETEGGASAVESGQTLTLTGGAADDQWIIIASEETVSVQDSAVTFTTTVASMSNDAALFFALLELDSDAGVGFDFTSDGNIELGTADDGPIHAGLQIPNYQASQPVKLSFTIEPTGVRITAVQGDNEVNSGLVANAQLSGFSAAGLPANLQPILAAGNANAVVVVDQVVIESTPVDSSESPELADVFFEIVQGDLDGENKYFVYMEPEAIGDDAGNATRIDLQRVNDTEFSRPEFEEGGLFHEYAYDSLSEFLAAHNGVHQFGIDYEGDGDYEDTFTIDVDLEGFTPTSFPDFATINSPTGSIDDTTPTITWDSINGAESLFVAAFGVNGPELGDLEELWYADLPAGATSVDTVTLPTGEDLLASVQANFRHDELASSSSDDGTVNVSFFTSSIATSPFTINETVDVSDPIADVRVDVGQVIFGGILVYPTKVDIQLDDDRVGGLTQVFIDGPRNDGFVQAGGVPTMLGLEGPGGVVLEMEPGDSETADEFIASLGGTYLVAIDFDGNGSHDETLEFTVDTTGLTTASFPAKPNILTPIADSTLPANERDVNISWEAHDDDFTSVFVHRNDESRSTTMFEMDLVDGETEVTTNPVLSGVDMFTVVAAYEVHDSVATTDDPINVDFVMGHYNLVEFQVDQHTRDVNPTDTVGFYGGDDNTVGGVEFNFTNIDFSGVTDPANFPLNFSAEYFPAYHIDQWASGAGSDDAWQSMLSSLNFTSNNVLQTWQADLTNQDGNDVPFDSVELTFKYDETKIDSPQNTLAEIESHLNIYYFNDTTNVWTAANVLTRDSFGDTITIEATDAASFVLAYDMSSSAAPHTPAGRIANVEIELNRFDQGDAGLLHVGFMEFGAVGANATQSTQFHLQRPGESAFTPLDGGWLPLSKSESQTTDQFIASLHGTYQVAIDYDGDGDHDDTFTMNLDVTGLTDSSFLATPTILSPAADATLPIEQRRAEVSYEFQDDADVMYTFASVDTGDGPVGTFISFRNVAETTTSVTTDYLPTDEDLIVGVAAVDEMSERTSVTSGDGTVSTEFKLASWSTSDFTIDEQIASVLTGSSSGSLAGGAGQAGGTQFDFTGVSRSSVYSADYFVLGNPDLPDNFEAWSYILDGEDRAESVFSDFIVPNEKYLQTWNLLLEDTNGDVPFSEVEVTFTYDDSLLAVHGESFNENDLNIYHFSDADDSWQPQTVIARDTTANTITVEATSFSAFVLGGRALVDHDNDAGDLVLDDDFDDGIGGVPSGWTVAEAVGTASLVEAGQTLTLTAGSENDQSVVLSSDGSIPIQGREVTYTTTVQSMSNNAAYYFALTDSSTDAGVGLDFSASGSIELSSPDDGPIYSGLQLPSYQPNQPVELSFTIRPDGIGITAVQGDNEVDTGLIPNDQLGGFSLAGLPANLQPILAAGNPNGEVVIDRVTIESTSDSTSDGRIDGTITGSDEFIVEVALAEFKFGNEESELLAVVDIDLENRSDITPLTRAYYLLPETGTFLAMSDYHIQNTSVYLGLELFQGVQSDADFLDSLGGIWNVLIDFDGDFDPASPNEEPSDGKFQFAWNDSDAGPLTPLASITNPTHGSTLPEGTANVTLQWDMPTDPGDDWGIDIEIDSEVDRDFGFETSVDSTARSLSVSNLPHGELLGAHVITSARDNFVSDVTIVSGFADLESPTVKPLVHSVHLVQFTIDGGEDDLQAATLAPNDIDHADLTTEQLAPIAEEAIERLAETGITQNQIEQLQNTSFEIADLDDNRLGTATDDSIEIDINAANHGWYIDPTPHRDDDDDIGDRIDLLTTVLHELNHVLGEDHADAVDDLMHAMLPTGTRRLPDGDETSALTELASDAALTDLFAEDQL